MSVTRIFAALLWIGQVAFGQTNDAKNCSADGTVVNSVTGAPIVRARVALTDSAGDSRTAETDASGAWSLDHLSCGILTIDASRLNFLPDKPRQPQTVLLAADVPMHDVKVRLAPQAVITGRVLDEQGDPVQNAQIMAVSSRVFDGVRRFQGSAVPSSNDIGEYRAAGLAAGKYVLCASGGRGPRNNSVKPADARTYNEQCFPGPMEAGPNSFLSIHAGYQGVIDFQLTSVAPPQPRHVRGTISGGPDAGRQITLFGRSGAFSAAILYDGTFDVADVVPGSYSLTATAFQDDVRYFAALPVEVGSADVSGLQVHLEAGMNVPGIVKVFSVSGIKNADSQYAATLTSSNTLVGPSPTRTVWADDNTSFTLTNVMPGSYRLRFTAPVPFYVKSATLGGLDIAGSEVTIGPGAGAIEVTISDDCGILQGDVSTDDTPGAASVLVLRDGAQHWNARADGSGHFKIEGLPPGDYKAYAWDDLTNVEFGNPEWMRLNAKGVSFTIQPGQATQVKLSRQVAPDE